MACKQKSANSISVEIDLPYSFKTKKAEFLSIEAFNLRKVEKYDEAIILYQQAINIEPDNPKLFFDISECYANNYDLTNALMMIDTAIILDSLNSHFYNNRGLIYWKQFNNEKAIVDYEKAIGLDSTNWVIYSNLSIAYYSSKKKTEACETFKVAQSLGLTSSFINNDNHLKNIEESCK